MDFKALNTNLSALGGPSLSLSMESLPWLMLYYYRRFYHLNVFLFSLKDQAYDSYVGKTKEEEGDENGEEELVDGWIAKAAGCRRWVVINFPTSLHVYQYDSRTITPHTVTTVSNRMISIPHILRA